MKLFGQSPAEFFKSKTNWVGMTSVVVSIVSYQTGAIDAVLLTQGVMGGLMAMALKDAIAKK